ncbi:ATP-binding protein, partial [Streptomyces sp. NL15-2K]
MCVAVLDARVERRPVPSEEKPDEGGPGLVIVEALAEKWEVRLRLGGAHKTVWAEGLTSLSVTNCHAPVCVWAAHRVGELTANAVRHGHVPSRDFHLLLHVIAPSRTVRIEVTDTRTDQTPPGPEALHAAGAEDTGGRGLLLVAALATRWGWHLRSEGPGK